MFSDFGFLALAFRVGLGSSCSVLLFFGRSIEDEDVRSGCSLESALCAADVLLVQVGARRWHFLAEVRQRMESVRSGSDYID